MNNKFKDLFISYGRRESLGFVARLHQRLKLAAYDGWFDKVNIPDGDDYAQRINHGIESAHNFVYVMAPRCMTSPYCLMELEYARLLGKRLIPINQMVISETPEQQLSAEDQQVLVNFYNRYNLPAQNIHTTKDVLNRSHALVGTTDWLDAKQNLSDEDCQKLVKWAQPYENNWAKHDDLEYLKTAQLPVFGEIIDTLESVVERIIAVLNRETDYVQRHSEILSDALHWQKNQKASVHLLVGKERIAAELWLLTDFLPPKQPPCQASTLVCEFICEARKNAENLMTDIFICYDIHHDKAIRDNVIQSLSRYAKTTWTHDRDIQKGADYEGVIDVGIGNADNFFFFISPDSVESEYCQRELAQALQYNKRIVPLLIVPTSNIPESLSKLQYIDLTNDDYDSHIDEILNILRQDEEYYKQHKVLLARALKWQTENQKPSFLLRGHNLDNAKTWLRLNDKREQHPPLPLHQKLISDSEAAKGQLSTEIFISYSRKDSDFARRLNTALQEAGKTTWFDQESISTGVDFENEIFKGINGTDNFLFVLSPDSVESEYCESEVKHAASQNKRFISILHREIEPTTQPEALRKINWIDFKDSTFDKSFPELVQAIELDREHAHQHTLLQQRSTDWDENNQSSDFLLNTTACSNAEQWLRTAKAKQPEPTESQQDFIQQSRQAIVAAESAVSKRRKITFAAITIGMIFAIFLSVFAFMQMNTSNENLQAAKARLYHAKAQALSETNAPLALRLAEKAREFDPLDETIDKTLQDIYAHGDLDLSSLPDGSGRVIPYRERNNLLLATYEIGKEPITITSDGKHIVKTASEWEVQKPLLTTLIGHQGSVESAEFSPDASLILTMSEDEDDKTAKIWDVQGNLIATLSGHQDQLNSATFSPNGALIVTASKDETAKVWDVHGKLMVTLSGHQDKLNSAEFSPNGVLIVTASDDKTAKVWDVQGKLMATLRHSSGVNSAAFSPDGALIVTASYDDDDTAKVWDVSGKLLATLSGHSSAAFSAYVKSAAFSPDGTLIVTTSDETAKVWDVQGNLLATLRHSSDAYVNSAAFSPNGASIVTAYDDKTARVWNVQGNLLTILSGHQDQLNSAEFSPNGALIVTASYDKTAKIWDRQGNLLTTLSGHQDKVNSATFSPDSTLIATISDDKTAKVWDVQGNLLSTLSGHQDNISSVTFSPDSTLIITTSLYLAKVWNVQGQLLATLSGHKGEVNTATFSPNSSLIVTTSNEKTAKLWDMQGNLLGTLGHQAEINTIAFSPDSNKIVTTSDDKTAKVWNVQGHLLATFEHQEKVKFAVFSTDGHQIKTITKNTVNVWRNGLFVGDFLKSEHLAKLTVADQIFAEVLTLEEISGTKEFYNNLQQIAVFYKDKADQSYITEVKKKYLQQAAIVYQKIEPEKGQLIKQELANLDYFGSNANKKLEPTPLYSQPTQVITGFANIPLVIFMGLLILIVIDQKKVFFQNQQYLQLIGYSLQMVFILCIWFLIRDGVSFGLNISIVLNDFQEITDVVLAALVAGIYFFHVRKHFQRQVLRTSLQIFCLILFLLLIGYLVYLLQGENTTIKLSFITEMFLFVIIMFLASASITIGHYYIDRMSKHPFLMYFAYFGIFCLVLFIWFIGFILYKLGVQNTIIKPSNTVEILFFVVIMFFPLASITIWYYNIHRISKHPFLMYLGYLLGTGTMIVIFDNALTFYNPIPTNLRFLLLLVAGIVLGQALWSQFYAYLHPQRKWLIVLGLMGIYSSIVYLSLMAFWNYGAFTFYSHGIQRVIFYYEISDVLTLLLAITAAGFAIVWAINWYKTQNYIKSGVYSVLALFLVSIALLYFRAYMSMLPFFAMVIGSLLLFIHYVGTGLVLTKNSNKQTNSYLGSSMLKLFNINRLFSR
jgi:WD40 repeat protein